jgi:hypothetical protein
MCVMQTYFSKFKIFLSLIVINRGNPKPVYLSQSSHNQLAPVVHANPQTLIKICALLTPLVYSSISESVTNLNLFTVLHSNGIRIYRDTCKCNGCAVFCIVVIFYTNKDIPNQHKMFMINRRHLKAAYLYHSSQASRNQLAHVSHPRRTPQTFLGSCALTPSIRYFNILESLRILNHIRVLISNDVYIYGIRASALCVV